MDKYNLITKNIKEIICEEELLSLVSSGEQITVYWGTAPTGRIHIGYFIPLMKIADFILAGCKVKILIADLHAFLDNMKSSLDDISARTEYYKLMITNMLLILNVNLYNIEFVQGTSFQLSPQYTMDMYKLHALTTIYDTKHAGAEVIKKSDNPPITGLLYPGLQALDMIYLKTDISFGGIDQRKIFMFANTFLPRIGYKKIIHLMNPMISGLRFNKKNEEDNLDREITDKMSSSNINSKIDLLDPPNILKQKINKCYCVEGDIEDNSLLDILDKLIFPLLKHQQLIFIIDRPEKYGGKIEYENINQVQNDFLNKLLHPSDLKMGIFTTIRNILEPIQKEFAKNNLSELILKAYN